MTADRTIDPKAAAAVQAAAGRKSWGRHATLRFLKNRGVPMRLYQLAVALRGEA